MEVLKRVNHPHIIQLEEVFETAKVTFIYSVHACYNNNYYTAPKNVRIFNAHIFIVFAENVSDHGAMQRW